MHQRKLVTSTYVALCIAGNKLDMEDHIQINEEELKGFADWVGCGYVMTSAWRNKGIEECFRKIVLSIDRDAKRLRESMITDKSKITIGDDKSIQKRKDDQQKSCIC